MSFDQEVYYLLYLKSWWLTVASNSITINSKCCQSYEIESPCYPLGNGQDEISNRTILDRYVKLYHFGLLKSAWGKVKVSGLIEQVPKVLCTYWMTSRKVIRGNTFCAFLWNGSYHPNKCLRIQNIANKCFLPLMTGRKDEKGSSTPCSLSSHYNESIW